MIDFPEAVDIGSKTFRVGDVVRFSASRRFGPVTSSGASITLPGRYVVRAIERRRPRTITRVYFHVRGLDKVSGSFTVFVSGKSYRRFAIRWRAYRVLQERIET